MPLSFPTAGEQSLDPSSAGPGASLRRWGQGSDRCLPLLPRQPLPSRNEAIEASEVQKHPEEVQH